MPRGDYHKLMIGSAQELNRLRNLGAGFSWKDAGRPLPSRLPEGMTTFLESSVVPINLSSSSSSDTDDDVPLSSRVKRPKVHLGDDVSAQKAPSNARADPQPAAPKLVDEQPATVVEPVQTVEEPVQETAASPGNATAPASCSKQDASKSVGTKRAKKSRQKADVNTEAAGTAQAFPPVSDTPANPEEDKKPGKSVKRTRAAAAKPQKKETVMEANKEKDIKSGPAPKAAPKKTVKVRKQAGAAKPQQKEPVINLEAKKEEDFEFTTAPKATPKKTVNLKTLQRENPKLYEAALNRLNKQKPPAAPKPNPAPPPAKKKAAKQTSASTVGSKKAAEQTSASEAELEVDWAAAAKNFWDLVDGDESQTAKSKSAKPTTAASKAAAAAKLRTSAAKASQAQKAPATKPRSKKQQKDADADADADYNPTQAGRKTKQAAQTSQQAEVKAEGKAASKTHAAKPTGKSDLKADFYPSSEAKSSEQKPENQGPKVEGAVHERTAPIAGKGASPIGQEPAEAEAGSAAGQVKDDNFSDSSEDTKMPADGALIPDRWQETERDVEAKEWQARQAVIQKQREEAAAQRKKKRADAEASKRGEMRINEYRETMAARISESTEKEALRLKWRKQLGKTIMGKQTLREILLVFKLPVEGRDLDSLRQAYKRAQIQFHPDRHVQSTLDEQIHAEEAFKIISEAAKTAFR